jgi:hypothetical protein
MVTFALAQVESLCFPVVACLFLEGGLTLPLLLPILSRTLGVRSGIMILLVVPGDA